MKTFILSLVLVSLVLPSCAQDNFKIAKAYAFYTVSLPGMQMADENGNPIPAKPIINRFLYIEWTSTGKPEIESVVYNNKPLLATITSIEGNTVVLGSGFSNNPDFKVVSKKCNSLWQIDLQPAGNAMMPETDCKNIVINTKIAGKSCSFKITKETQLNLLPRY